MNADDVGGGLEARVEALEGVVDQTGRRGGAEEREGARGCRMRRGGEFEMNVFVGCLVGEAGTFGTCQVGRMYKRDFKAWR